MGLGESATVRAMTAADDTDGRGRNHDQTRDANREVQMIVAEADVNFADCPSGPGLADAVITAVGRCICPPTDDVACRVAHGLLPQ
jgi:hypothetical protein